MTAALRIREPIGGWFDPWTRLIELADVLPPDRWALVGGLMVQAHALAAGVETTRVTTDVDATVRIEGGVFSYGEAAARLVRLGYKLDTTTRLAYRFRRSDGDVDLMVADHEHPSSRFSRRNVMAVVGGRQALSRVTEVVVESDGDHVVPLPNLHGALVLKAAARAADARDRDRHALDAITLLACIVEPSEIADGVAGSDRKRIASLLRALEANRLLFSQMPRDTALLAQRTLGELKNALRIDAMP